MSKPAIALAAALTPEGLAADFGPRNPRCRRTVRALHTALASLRMPLADEYLQWARRAESRPAFRKALRLFWSDDEVRHLDTGAVLLVLHTYYALIVKLVTLRCVDFGALSGVSLQRACADLESGGPFRRCGLRNFIESDGFGWYLKIWSTDLEEALCAIVQRLHDCEPLPASESARDLLKALYHALFSREIRHDFGEYYTPDWLAERVVTQTL